MAYSKEVRLLAKNWGSGLNWPQRLESLEISGIRGWTGERVVFNFPIVAVVGENGCGKSTLLQAAASVYKQKAGVSDFASDFFPDTPFEKITGATIKYTYRQGANVKADSIRKPTTRWLGNPTRPTRPVSYIDLNRIQPISKRTGFTKLLKRGVAGAVHTAFTAAEVLRLGTIIGKKYLSGSISNTSADPKRLVPVLDMNGINYSGFHQGAGELAAAELLARVFPQYSLVLIDEIETSLHPRAQRRLIRDLATLAREKDLQIILTTHSPYVLAELPPEARIYLMQSSAGKSVVSGVSPEFAMTQMDEEAVPECDLYVEDPRAATWVREALISAEPELARRVQTITYGGEQVGVSLGTMNVQKRFPRKSVVYLDGDQPAAQGTVLLPGGDAPERIVFAALKQHNWLGVDKRIGRQAANTIDALDRAMLLPDAHLWPVEAANTLLVGSDQLWQALTAVWAESMDSLAHREEIVAPVRDAFL